jgi:hypothetical protein
MRTRRLSALASLAAAVALGGLALNPVVGMAEPGPADGSNGSLTIDERASMSENGQEVQVSGTYSCAQGSAILVVGVLQGVNSEKRIFGHERNEVSCPAESQKWTMNVPPADTALPFEAGTAQVSVTMKIDKKKTRSHREVQISK